MDGEIKTKELIQKAAEGLCGGNEEAEKEFIEYVENLVKARENLFIHDVNQLPLGYKYKSGDLVYNSKNKEFGFIIGPIDPWSEHPENSSSSPVRRYAMVTIPPNHPKFKNAYQEIHGEEPPTTFTPNSGYFSIRYPKQKDLDLFVTETTDPLLGNVGADIELFCKHQCIMECSDICFFHKYGKYPKS